MQGIYDGEKGDNVKNISPHFTQSIYMSKNQIKLEKGNNPEGPLWHGHDIEKTQHRQEQHKGRSESSWKKRDAECSTNKE
jgi:hypothetical protein